MIYVKSIILGAMIWTFWIEATFVLGVAITPSTLITVSTSTETTRFASSEKSTVYDETTTEATAVSSESTTNNGTLTTSNPSPTTIRQETTMESKTRIPTTTTTETSTPSPLGRCSGGSRDEIEHCCNSTHRCGLYEGDCDRDDECEGDLICGMKKCGRSFTWQHADCCVTKPSYLKLSKQCYTEKYGLYSSLSEAEVACNGDDWCAGIYHYTCKGTYFYLCPIGKSYANGAGGCIYHKEAGTYEYAGINRSCTDKGLITIANLNSCYTSRRYFDKGKMPDTISDVGLPGGCFLNYSENKIYFNRIQTHIKDNDASPICRTLLATSAKTSSSTVTTSVMHMSQNTSWNIYSSTRQIFTSGLLFDSTSLSVNRSTLASNTTINKEMNEISTSREEVHEDSRRFPMVEVIGGIIASVTLLSVLGVFLIWLKKRKAPKEEEYLDDHAGYDSIYLPDNPHPQENQISKHANERKILDDDATSIKITQNPYYGCEPDLSGLSDREKQRIESVVVVQNPYYE